MCVHGFIEENGNVYQTLPWNHRGWHSGSGAKGNGNDTYIGVEMTEPVTIAYTSGANFTDKDRTKTNDHIIGTYQTAVELFAFLCKEYKLDPLGDGVITSHAEGHQRGIASNHGDPEHLWSKFGLSLVQFRKDIKAAMTADVLYRVQIGAFGKKENAEKLRDELKSKGYDAFVTFTGGYHKVQVGAYKVKENADSVFAVIKKAGYDAFVTTVNPETP